MKKNDFKYVLLRYIVFIVIYILIFVGLIYGLIGLDGLKWFDYEFKEFAISFFGYMTIYFLITILNSIVSIVLHELGHLWFGLKAKLKFLRFNIFNITIKKEKNKFKVMKLPSYPGSIGSCTMKFEEDKEYDKVDIIRYFLGGIIVNFFLAFLGCLLLIIFNNIWIELIGLTTLLINMYNGIINSIPYASGSGLITDMYHVKNCKKDKNYIKMFTNFSIITEQIFSGKDIKDLDEKYFIKPQKIQSTTEVTMAIYYAEYLIDYERYKEAYDYIKDILEKKQKHLFEGDINNFKLSLITCIFELDLPIEEIEKYWDLKLEKFIDMYTYISPDVLATKYIYYKLVKQDNKKAEEILKKYNKIKENFHEKHLLKKSDEIITKINKK